MSRNRKAIAAVEEALNNIDYAKYRAKVEAKLAERSEMYRRRQFRTYWNLR